MRVLEMRWRGIWDVEKEKGLKITGFTSMFLQIEICAVTLLLSCRVVSRCVVSFFHNGERTAFQFDHQDFFFFSLLL